MIDSVLNQLQQNSKVEIQEVKRNSVSFKHCSSGTYFKVTSGFSFPKLTLSSDDLQMTYNQKYFSSTEVETLNKQIDALIKMYSL